MRYFISFAHSNGFGNCDVTTHSPINSWQTLEEIKKMFEDKGYEQIIILFWKKLI